MRIATTALLALLLSSPASALQQAQSASTKSPAPTADADIVSQQLPSYPLTSCPVSKESLDAMGSPLDLVHEGRLVRLCCKSCIKEFKKDPALILKAIDDAVVAAQKASYPLAKCPVSGHDLEAEAMDLVHGTRLVRLCCKDCVAGFQKEPSKFMATIDAAMIADQKKTYPLTTCLVSGEKIEGDGADMLYGTRLVRFCCKKCGTAFDKEPAKHLAALDRAAVNKMAPKKN